MKIDEVVTYLAERSLKSNPETVRRWIRSGKLEATLTSRKAGYDVSVPALESFIAKNDWRRIRGGRQRQQQEYDQGFSAGQLASAEQYEERLRAMMANGSYEKAFGVDRVELQRAVLADPLTKRSQAILIGINQTFFGLYVTSKPWSKVSVHCCGRWMTWGDYKTVVDRRDYPSYVEPNQLTQRAVLSLIVAWAQRAFQEG